MNELLKNTLFWAPLFASMSAQILKVLIILLLDRRFDPDRLTETGGMPSSHSATVSALATAAGITYGVGSPLFAICMTFGLIVIYDATGVRRAAGRHAEVLNTLVSELAHLIEDGKRPEVLKTLLGHNYSQVFVGTLLGVLVGYLTTQAIG